MNQSISTKIKFIKIIFVSATSLLVSCHTKEGIWIPFEGTIYDYSYLNSLEGGKLGEPLQDVEIEDEATAIELYGSLESAKTFKSYFPDDIRGGKELDIWWKSPFRIFRSDKNIVKTIRHGFRNTNQDKVEILRWVSERYGTPHNFRKEESLKAYWLMYYASFSPEEDVRDSAVRYGIGQHQGADAELIAKRLIQLAMEDEKYTKFAVGVANNRGGRLKDLFLNHLEPYLYEANLYTQNKALILQKKIIENIRR